MRTNPQASFPHQAGHPSYYGAPQPSTNYGLYFNQATLNGPRHDYLGHGAATSGFDTRKRHMETVDSFFGNAKRRQVEPNSYAQISQNLVPLHGMIPMPMGPGQEYMGAPAMQGPVGGGGGGPAPSGPGPLTQNYYLPHIPNARTQKDLVQLDEILAQMQSTVYDHAPQVTQNGVIIRDGNTLDMRASPSPPGARGHVSGADAYAQPATSAAHMASPLTALSSTGTPAVTPPSSAMSYSSGQSPSPSTSSMSPQSRHSSVAYPNLPALSSAFPGQSTTATLGPTFDMDERRYHSGGMLQRASAAPPRSMLPPMSPPIKREMPTRPAPARSPSAESESSEAREYDSQYEKWVENMRTIERLRGYIAGRLKLGDYEKDGAHSPRPMDVDNTPRGSPRPEKNEERKKDEGLYPSLKMGGS